MQLIRATLAREGSHTAPHLYIWSLVCCIRRPSHLWLPTLSKKPIVLGKFRLWQYDHFISWTSVEIFQWSADCHTGLCPLQLSLNSTTIESPKIFTKIQIPVVYKETADVFSKAKAWHHIAVTAATLTFCQALAHLGVKYTPCNYMAEYIQEALEQS